MAPCGFVTEMLPLARTSPVARFHTTSSARNRLPSRTSSTLPRAVTIWLLLSYSRASAAKPICSSAAGLGATVVVGCSSEGRDRSCACAYGLRAANTARTERTAARWVIVLLGLGGLHIPGLVKRFRNA